MKRYLMSEARKELTDLVSRVAYGGERIVIGRRNKDLAVLVSKEDAKLLEYLEDQEDIREAQKALQDPRPGIPWEEVKKSLKLETRPARIPARGAGLRQAGRSRKKKAQG